jgi:hypothetical protein
MTHIAVQESLNGKNADWLEKVTDEEHLRGVQQWAAADIEVEAVHRIGGPDARGSTAVAERVPAVLA